MSGKWQERETEELFREWKRTGDPALRERIILIHKELVHALAGKFKDRGEPYEDLVQVAWVGLIKSVDRFDPDRGHKFLTYAVPTITGELKRYFRDKGWTVRVPRRMQELSLKLAKVHDELAQKLRRLPNAQQLAQELGVTEEEVLEAMEITQAYDPASLDREMREMEAAYEEERSEPMIQRLADMQEMERLFLKAEIQDAMRVLNERERQIIQKTFYEECSQTEIAKEMGISQMHVSRLLRRALKKMRQYLE